MFTRDLGVRRERKGIRQKKLNEGRVKNLDEDHEVHGFQRLRKQCG